jgi:hypothetical protein
MENVCELANNLKGTQKMSDRQVLTDPSPAALARRQRKIVEQIARLERQLSELVNLERLFGGRQEKCSICGASTAQHRQNRCRGACKEA